MLIGEVVSARPLRIAGRAVLQMEKVVGCHVEEPREEERHLKARHVPLPLDGVDALPRHSDRFRQLLLGPAVPLAQLFDAVDDVCAGQCKGNFTRARSGVSSSLDIHPTIQRHSAGFGPQPKRSSLRFGADVSRGAAESR